MNKYNECEGCKLWDGHHCTGARSYEPNADEHRAICNEHMAKQFWVVSKQLYNSEARIKELEKESEALKAQKDTFASLMNIYKDISKGRQDSKIVADYINKLEQKLQIAEDALGLYQ